MQKETYPIGTEFTLKRGKRSPQRRVIVDKLSTYNSAGELVKVRYVTEHVFMGQVVTDRDVLPVTIKMALAN